MKAAGKLGRGFNGFVVLLLALAGGVLIALALDIALPVAILLLPGLLALPLDRSPGCGVARAILLFQLAVCVRPILGAWYRCDGIDGCMAELAAWPAIFPAWLAAAAAWLLTQILPLGLKILDDYRTNRQRQALTAKRQALVEEWGLDNHA